MKRIIIMAAAAIVACDNAPSTGEQVDYDTRIEGLEARVKRLEAARPAARPQPKRPDPATVYYVPVDDMDSYRGATNAKVTIVEAYEYACPYCALVEPVLAGVVEKYRGTDTLKVVSKQFVVHPQVATAPALATCAASRQAKFEEFSAALWKRSWKNEGGRPRMDATGLTRDAILEVAASSGLDRAKFVAELDGPACKAKLEADRKALSAVGVRGTPTLYLNGRPYVGARTIEALSAAIETEARKFDLASGSVDGWYAGLMKSAKRRL